MSINMRLDALLDSFIDAGVPGCGLSVSYKGKTMYTGYRGFADIESSQKIDKNTLYRIASCTKNITATAVMTLYEQGKLLLNDPVSNYLPSFKDICYQTLDGSGEIVIKKTSEPLTIKHLLTMTSGIPYMGKGSLTSTAYLDSIGTMSDMYKYTLYELAEKISNVPLDFDPGTHWRYGMSYDVLGVVVEAVSGMKFSQYLKKMIFEPLGMEHTTFYCSKEMEKDLAKIYFYKNGKHTYFPREPNITETNGNKLESGGGGLLSTLEDLAKFATMWAQSGIYNDKRILGSQTIRLMRKNHLTGGALEDFERMSRDAYPWYKGYGWGLAGRTMISCEDAGSNGNIGEFGWCGAFGPYIMADPEAELGVAYTQQMFPTIGGMQDYCHPRIRNTVYSLLDEFKRQLLWD